MKKRITAVVVCMASLVAICLHVAASSDDFERDIIYCRQNRYYFDKAVNGETAEDRDWEFTFDVFSDATFAVDTEGQDDLTLGANCDYDEVLLDRYPDSKLLFFNGNGDHFRHYGTLFLPAEKGSYLYRNIDRTLYDIGAAYNEEAGGFLLRTRNLSQYVISDQKLEAEKLEADSALLIEPLE